jgi:hypothetical protein
LGLSFSVCLSFGSWFDSFFSLFELLVVSLVVYKQWSFCFSVLLEEHAPDCCPVMSAIQGICELCAVNQDFVTI